MPLALMAPHRIIRQTTMTHRLIERRHHRRRPALVGTHLSFSMLTESSTPTDADYGDALLRNLSLSGCQIESEIPLITDYHYALLLQHRIDTKPITITRARVIWGVHPIFGLRFIHIAPVEERAIKELLRQLPITKV